MGHSSLRILLQQIHIPNSSWLNPSSSALGSTFYAFVRATQTQFTASPKQTAFRSYTADRIEVHRPQEIDAPRQHIINADPANGHAFGQSKLKNGQQGRCTGTNDPLTQ